MDVQHLGAPETPSEVHVGSASIARAGLKLEPPSTHSQLRWLGLLAPIPAAAYAVWQQGSVSSLVLLAVCLLVGAVLFFVSVGRPSR